MHSNARRWLATGLAVVALGAGLGACGDDDDDDVAASGSASGSEAEADGTLATYCEKTVQIETAPDPEVDWETASEEEIATAIKSYANDTLLPIADDIKANAPEEIADDIALLHAAVVKVADTGDFEGAFETPEVSAAEDRVHEHDLEACGWTVVDVTATNYAFEGIPDELEAKTTSFELTNEGTELHELIVIRKNDDTTESFDELLEMPEEEAQQKTTFITATFTPPGESDSAIAELEAGEYIALCFIPVGSVDEETEVDGPPHFTQGMKHEFTVS